MLESFSFLIEEEPDRVSQVQIVLYREECSEIEKDNYGIEKWKDRKFKNTLRNMRPIIPFRKVLWKPTLRA